MKYHVNQKGDPGICHATQKCPFGGEDKHYSSKEAARAAYEEYYYGSANLASHRRSEKDVEVESSRRGVWNSRHEPIDSVVQLDSDQAAALSSALYQMEDFFSLASSTRGEFLLAPNHAQTLTDMRDSFGAASGDVLVLTNSESSAMASFLSGLDAIEKHNGKAGVPLLAPNHVAALYKLRSKLYGY